MDITHIRHTVIGYGIRIEDRRQNGSYEPTTYWTCAKPETRGDELHSAGKSPRSRGSSSPRSRER